MYSPEKQSRYPTKPNRRNNRTMFVLCFFAAVTFLFVLWKREAVADFLLPGNADQFIEASSGMLELIRSGTPVGEAITSFCMEIVGYELLPA